MRAKYSIDNDITGTPEATKPKQLTEEDKYNRYSTAAVEKHYKDTVYYRQRKGGDGWFHGRSSQAYKDNYPAIFGHN